MNIQDFEREAAKLKADYDKKILALRIKYASDNNPVVKGDIISSSKKSICVESMEFYFSSKLIGGYVYSGTRLTKEKEVFRGGKKATIYQEDMIEHISAED